MNILELPKAWRAAGSRLRALAATYPEGHVTRACLLNRIGALELCSQDLEGALQAMCGQAEGRLDTGTLSLAIEAVEAGLQVTRRQLQPDKKAALVMAAYALIKEGVSPEPQPQRRIVRRGFAKINGEDIRVNAPDGTIVEVYFGPDGIPLVIGPL